MEGRRKRGREGGKEGGMRKGRGVNQRLPHRSRCAPGRRGEERRKEGDSEIGLNEEGRVGEGRVEKEEREEKKKEEEEEEEEKEEGWNIYFYLSILTPVSYVLVLLFNEKVIFFSS